MGPNYRVNASKVVKESFSNPQRPILKSKTVSERIGRTIIEDTSEKASTTLPDFEGMPTFEGFLVTDHEGDSSESDNAREKEQSKPVPTLGKSRMGRTCTLKSTAKAKERDNVRTSKNKGVD